jgi:hypothetical protein
MKTTYIQILTSVELLVCGGGGGRCLTSQSQFPSIHQRDLTHVPPTKLVQMDVNRKLYPFFVNLCALYDLLQ